MKKIFLLFATLASFAPVCSQGLNPQIDNGSIIVTKIVEGIPADASTIHARAMNYLARTYNDSNSVIQTNDKENGLIIGKGLYGDLTVAKLYGPSTQAYHTLRIDIKDGRTRIICSVEDINVRFSNNHALDFQYRVVDYAPVADRAPAMNMTKNKATDAYNALIPRMQASVESCAAALLSGGVLNTEQSDW